MSDRCPYCSFYPTSMTDYCHEHQPITQMELQDAVNRTERVMRNYDTMDALWADWELIYRAMRMAGMVV